MTDLITLHETTTNNQVQLANDGGGWCGFCRNDIMFNTLDWYDTTGVCSLCGTDCVIPSSIANSLTASEKEAFVQYWFKT